MDHNSGPIARWPLAVDARDMRGSSHGVSHGVSFRDGAALFDGRNAYIEVPNSPALQPGAGAFSLAVWVRTESVLDHVLGDVISKYNSQERRGINLSIMDYAGVTSAQANYRNLFFGIDNGTSDPEWADCGRPGNSLMVWALCVFQGDLYAGTFETGKNESGHVYRYAGGREWVDCGAPANSNAVTALAELDGALYAAASHYRSRGSSISESENVIPGGTVYRYEGGAQWTGCGTLDNPEAIFGMAVFRGQLYASSMYAPPGVFRFDGKASWQYCGHPGGRVAALTVHRGSLYGTGYDAERAGVYRYAGGENWEDCGTPPGVTQSYSFAQHHGDLYLGTWPGGRVFRYDGDMGWADTGQLGEEEEVMGLAVYNGKLYGGTLPLAEVYRYDGDGAWIRTGQLDTTPDVRYRRAWSMAVFQGRLFCGTLPSGHVFSMEAGKGVTYDQALAPGWRHIVAARRQNQLALYVDGREVAASATFVPEDFDLSNDEPLRIGVGTHDYFYGSMRDLRLYERALNADEIMRLYQQSEAKGVS